MDFWEALPFTVAELPFHGMKRYPYTTRDRFPDDPATLAYRLDWNNRMETGDRIQRYQFDYKHTPSEPIQTAPGDTRAAR